MSLNAVNSVNNNYNVPGAVNNFPSPASLQPYVSVATPNTKQIYDYPQTSVYNAPDKKAASGVNIYIYNPSGIGAPSTINNSNYGTETPAPPIQPMQNLNASIGNTPIANTPIRTENEKKPEPPAKKKNIVKLDNDYIKTLESFMRSQDSSIRKQGIQDLLKRFEEDDTRFDNPSLTALLNIGLQDPDVHNRMIALSIISSGIAHGDKNTIQLLNMLKNSDKMYGQEAKLASNALLKASQSRETIPDYSK